MRRLAIIDLGGGQQPIYNEDRSVAVVLNGEIYNYREIREQLSKRGHKFETASDTEVIVHLYEEYGADAPRHLSGMFAFAIWDSKKQILVLARDRLGIKPLYYAAVESGFVFGSEIKAVLASGVVPTEIDHQAVDEFLTYSWIPGPRTIFSSIRELEPGVVLTVSHGRILASSRYWDLESRPDFDRAAHHWMKDCENSLRQAVERHMISDVPIGAFLSGGVDSGLIVAMMAQMATEPIKTFTVGFKGAGSAFIDERVFARALAKRYRLDHREIEVSPDLEAAIWDITAAFDQPFADDSVFPSYYICKAAAAHVKVTMSGLGGDELFAGYRRHLGALIGSIFDFVPKGIRERLLSPLVLGLPEPQDSGDKIDHLKRLIRAAGLPVMDRYQDSMATLPWKERCNLLQPSLARKVSPELTRGIITDCFSGRAGDDALDAILRTDIRRYLSADVLPLTDRLSMWHSLEVRVPYLDHSFVETAMAVPSQLKIRHFQQKYLLKRMARSYLPHEMIYHKKQGFESPMADWLRGPLLPLFRSVVNKRSVDGTGLLSFQKISHLLDEHVARRRRHSKILFSVLMFMCWHRSQGAPALA